MLENALLNASSFSLYMSVEILIVSSEIQNEIRIYTSKTSQLKLMSCFLILDFGHWLLVVFNCQHIIITTRLVVMYSWTQPNPTPPTNKREKGGKKKKGEEKKREKDQPLHHTHVHKSKKKSMSNK